jgi:hypothetical protein
MKEKDQQFQFMIETLFMRTILMWLPPTNQWDYLYVLLLTRPVIKLGSLALFLALYLQFTSCYVFLNSTSTYTMV